MKLNRKNNYLLLAISLLFVSLACLIQGTPKVCAQRITEDFGNYYHDIINGSNGVCYTENLGTRVIDSANLCNEHSVTHGPGRENGGTNILSTGCRNYMGINFRYGTTDIPYWINMNSMNLITNTTHRNQIVSDIRYQLSLWNKAVIHDGTGQIVNFYEVFPGTLTKPGKINGKEVIEVLQDDLTKDGLAGVFKSLDCSVTLCYNHTTSAIGYNPDTIAHEFGHVLGLNDIDSANKVVSGTHHTLMSYGRATSYSTIDNAIKYQDIQGVASFNNQHTQHDYKRYVYGGTNYLHICYYCDRIDEQSFAKTGSYAIVDDTVCSHTYEQFISLGETHWLKCLKCYKVIESEFAVSVSPVTHEIELLYFLNTSKNNVSIPDQIGGLSVISIGANAFENCTSLTSVSGFNNIVSIGAQAFKGCSSLTNIFIPAATTSIGAGAFAGCSDLNISVSSSNPNYSASDNILYNKTGTVINSACNISDMITIPNSVTEILPYAFYDNDNLETLHIYGAPTIGMLSFANCENLVEVYCYSYTIPTLGVSSFTNDVFTLYTPYSKQTEYVTAFAGYVNSASSIPVTISFSSDGMVVDTLNTYFGANITGLTNPSKTGYNFAGWYDNTAYIGTIYANGGLWDTTSNMTVYAKWSPQTYYIYFTGYGSENISDKEVTYDALIGTMPSVSRTGYTFYGWKNQYNEYFTSDMIWQKLSNQTVSPDLRANQYTITYNGNGGTANAQSQSVYYDSVISSFASAYREGYTFTGWNTNANGSGQTITAPYTYVIDDDTTLYAQYTANEYNVTFDKQGGIGGSDGVNAIYNSPMPSGTSITAPTKNGYTFLGYYRYADGLGTKYYNADMTSANIWNLSDDTTLFAYWLANQYTVTLDQQNGSGGTNSVNATYNVAMPSGANIIAPTRTGYSFQGYFQNVNGGGTKYYNSDMTSNNVWDASENSTIYAYWTPNTYTISLQREGGINGSTIVQATYNSPMNSATAPTRVGYTFQGYFQNANGGGTKYYNSDMTSAHVWDIADNGTLYAYWLGNQFTVTFNKQGGSGGTTNTNVVYGSAMPGGLIAPTKNLYVFIGYYDGTTNDSTMYYDSNMVSVHNWDKLTNTTLFARWRGVYYNITYSNLTFLNQTADVLLDNYIGNYAPTYYEYGVGLDLTRVSAFYQPSSPYSPHLRFLGWYTSMNFNTQKTSISQSSTGNVTIYAKWKYDYDNPSRSGTYTINNADPLNQTYYDQKYIGLGYNNLYQDLINIGITKLTFSFKLRSWGEGTQHVFVYSENGTQLASTTFNSTSSATVHTYQFTINLSSLGSSNYIYIRYQADTYWSWFQYKSRYWYCDYLYMEMSYVVNESDFYNPEFYWHYQDPFD